MRFRLITCGCARTLKPFTSQRPLLLRGRSRFSSPIRQIGLHLSWHGNTPSYFFIAFYLQLWGLFIARWLSSIGDNITCPRPQQFGNYDNLIYLHKLLQPHVFLNLWQNHLLTPLEHSARAPIAHLLQFTSSF